MKNLFRRIVNATQGETPEPPSSQNPEQATPQQDDAPLNDAPPKRETVDQDLFNFKTIGGSKPVSTDELVAKMVEGMPILGELLTASSEEEKIRIIQSKLSPEKYEGLLMMLSVIEYHYKTKAKRVDESLALAKVQYRLATMLPQDWDPQGDIGHSRTRHVADTLQGLGSAYLSLGEFSKALDYNLQAEEWYERDSEERSQRGIVKENADDKLFHERDVRAILFETTAGLYHRLGDSGKAIEYARRTAEIDLSKPTYQSRVANLLDAGQGSASRGDFDRALAAYREALDVALADPNSKIVVRDVVTVCHHIGDLLARLRLFRQAFRYHERALELNQGAGHLERMSYDHRSIGRIFEARPDLGDALEQYEAALRCVSVAASEEETFMWQTSDGDCFRILDPDVAWSLALAAARIHAERHDYDRAEELLTLTIDLGEVMRANVAQNEYRTGFQAQRMDAYQNMVKLQVQLARQDLANEGKVSEHKTRALIYTERARSRSFLDMLGTSFISLPSDVPAELKATEASLVERLRSLSQKDATTASEGQHADWATYEATRAELEKVWQEIITRTPEAADYVELRRGRPIDMTELRELLVP
jgi:tetratricopeptide (TPR) repeat protein